MKMSRASRINLIIADQSLFPPNSACPRMLLRLLSKNAAPGETRPRTAQRCAADYWFGSMSCVNPVVLMSRNIGVRGGSSVGFRKFTSNR
jgi:hypothetical protein